MYSNPTQRPYKPDLHSTPFTSRGYATVKHPNSNYTSDEKAINHTIGTLYNSTINPNIWVEDNEIATFAEKKTETDYWTSDDDFKGYDLSRNNLKLNLMEYL
ncbi:hypothetical protein C2G38_2231858 [Gigaspora rosea]|uniref:Uncharacterized protein n=1 Tax=Gigaspora rosea TaxID=44941 RepID=A0A397TWJ9_9GLOM|nr:hypothetical protein C2G38_2231858 [Gigaspora rosea]